MNARKAIKGIFYPIIFLRRQFIEKVYSYYKKHNLRKLAGLIYYQNIGKILNWKNPQNLNEKINWLKFYSDTSKWTELADKYRVRDYVRQKGLEEILVKLYGVWENAGQINFDILPRSFVLKTNHGCGTVIVVKNKADLNLEQTRKTLNEWLHLEFGRDTAEPHYLGIKPLIIAEELLQPENGCLVDYKFFMTGGKLSTILLVSDRVIGESYKLSTYDENWQYVPQRLNGVHSKDNVKPLPKPQTFEQMKQISEILSKDFPQVRVDLYEVNGKVYFGELTFTSQGGYMSYFSKEELLRMGRNVTLPKKQIN